MTTAHHVGFIIGPSIGGLMIDYLSWRYSFFFLVPIGICGTLLFAKFKAARAELTATRRFHRLSRSGFAVCHHQCVGDAARPANTTDDRRELKGRIGRSVLSVPYRIDFS
jgi:MFS family permease